jgi:hypothetical protein
MLESMELRAAGGVSGIGRFHAAPTSWTVREPITAATRGLGDLFALRG